MSALLHVQLFSSAPPMNDSCSSLPVITTSLLSKGKNTIGHETNLARTPIWHARPCGTTDDTVVSLFLFGHPFRKVEGRNLTTTDQRLFAHLTTVYVRAGCPESRQVPFSLSEASELLGYETAGGRQRALVRASLGRLRSVTFESALRHPDGHETVIGWGSSVATLSPPKAAARGGSSSANPSPTYSEKEASPISTHRPGMPSGEVAGRLWSFLESERIGKGWRYPLLSGDEATRRSSPTTLAIADVPQLNWDRDHDGSPRGSQRHVMSPSGMTAATTSVSPPGTAGDHGCSPARGPKVRRPRQKRCQTPSSGHGVTLTKADCRASRTWTSQPVPAALERPVSDRGPSTGTARLCLT